MKRVIGFFVVAFCVWLQQTFVFASAFSIVFVHIGNALPTYLETAVEQANLFNPQADIYLVANERAVKNFPMAIGEHTIHVVTCESLENSLEHKLFLLRTSLNSVYRGGFWKYATERFFYLQELIAQHGLHNVCHLENDVMLYVDLDDLLPVFQKYQGIAATFDNDQRCIPGFLYIANPYAINQLSKYLADHAHDGLVDMEIIAKYKKERSSSDIDNLPIRTAEYVGDHPLVSTIGFIGSDKNAYCKNIEIFQSVFDAAALGQYLGGVDPSLAPWGPGFINERCVFNPSLFSYEWDQDAKGRKVPHLIYAGKKFRINNLHIHCKNLKMFSSI